MKTEGNDLQISSGSELFYLQQHTEKVGGWNSKWCYEEKMEEHFAPNRVNEEARDHPARYQCFGQSL